VTSGKARRAPSDEAIDDPFVINTHCEDLNAFSFPVMMTMLGPRPLGIVPPISTDPTPMEPAAFHDGAGTAIPVAR
jgi:hypothetical protein